MGIEDEAVRPFQRVHAGDKLPEFGGHFTESHRLIIDEFKKYGVDVTAETLTGFFVGPGTPWFLEFPKPSFRFLNNSMGMFPKLRYPHFGGTSADY